MFFEFIFKNKFSKYGQKREILSKNSSILFSKDFLAFPSYKKSKLSCPFNLGEYSIEVSVLQFDNVKLNDGFIGNCNPYLPQYLISAIFEGDSQTILPSFGLKFFEIKIDVSIKSQK